LGLSLSLHVQAQEEDFEEVPAEVRPLLVRLEHYKPIYFVTGNPDTKVQLSLKFRIFDNEDIYFAYSQLLVWDLFKRSSPIRDTDYNPDIFYRWHQPDDKESWIDFGLWEHESNGQEKEPSRSWDRSYIRYRSATRLGWHDTKVYWSLKAWVPYRLDGQNRDIAHYRGLWELNFSLANIFGESLKPDDLTLRLYPGGKSCVDPTAGGAELTLRMRPFLPHFLREMVIQIFHGYGEDLLDYKTNRWGVRAGIGF
jgi:outer membrane phospholipase A